MEFLQCGSCFLLLLLGAITALSNYFLLIASGATLVPAEVEVLKQIATTLGKEDWNFAVDPCSGESGWRTLNAVNGEENAVNCTCFNTTCHVNSIVLKRQSLPGVLPPELVKLPYLQEIDLSLNFLNGSFPREWGSMQLVNMSIMGNRVSGSIPKEFGNITTLKVFNADFNRLSGVLPAELGNLINIERMLINSNNFTGALPETLAKLTMLKDFWISDNQFSGKIPNFIGNWTNLDRIVMQASGLEGPIPSRFSLLTNITDMRITDLTGTEDTFPPLSNIKNIRTLVLRSCNIIGGIPGYLGDMPNLRTLDISFNKLTGQIPHSFDNLVNAGVDFIYLTGNSLTGPVSERVLGGDNIDLSYNNFTLGRSNSSSCQYRTINLFGSASLGNSSTGIVACLESVQCPRDLSFSLHINCGGREFMNGSTKYEDDDYLAGPSTFYRSRTNWALSSTGDFMDNSNDVDAYIARSTTGLTMSNSEVYMNARLSPLSLTYYGFCLLNGNYTVSLHFAEIMFTNDTTYSSLGRRVFDIYIQGKLVWKDFNIEDEAGGVGKAIIKKSTAVVTSSTLEIRFYWAGKGTQAIPARGTYGPLVSAISVDPDFKPPLKDGSKISPGTVVGIVLSAVSLIIIVVGVLWWKRCSAGKNEIDQELRGLDLQTGSFTLRQIKVATNNFSAENKIGEGGFGPVYKGHLSDGTIIAVKQLSSKSKQGNREFVTEIGMISALQHPNLVKLFGCCIEGNQLLLIYEYLENNSLGRALFGHEESQLKLDWPTRHKICVGIAKALAYLHEESRLRIVHRDIKATNVLLDKDLNAKVSDFGLAKLDEDGNTHISTRIAGTIGYMAPEYALRGYLTDKADVYSFGIVALEIISGQSNTNYRLQEECIYLLDWALVLKERGDLMELADPRLESNYVKEEMMTMINVALLCTNASPTLRPKMSTVVSMLEGRTAVEKFVSDLSLSNKDDVKFKAIRNYYQFSQESMSDTQTQSRFSQESMSDSQTQSMLMDASSSISGFDLYPTNSNSQISEKR